MTRLQDFIQKNREALALELCLHLCDESDIAAAITNGDLELPSWISILESDDHLKMWDNEEVTNGAYNSQYWGFIIINY